MKGLLGKLTLLTFLVCMIALLTPAFGQAGSSTAGSSPTLAKSLTVDDVIKLSQAGLSEDVIAQKVKKNGVAFDLTPDQLIQLKKAGVSDKVVQTMLDPTKSDAPTATAATGPGAKPAPDPSLPDEAGVYYKKPADTTWNEILPEVINWKSGGVMKGIASYGVVKGDMNGHIQGKSSPTIASTITQFLVVTPESVAITEYQLLRLHQNSDNREFRSMTGGVFHSSGGATKDAVQFDSKKIAPHRFLITLSDMKAGEYGFLPPGAVNSTNAAGSTGKIYSFKIIE